MSSVNNDNGLVQNITSVFNCEEHCGTGTNSMQDTDQHSRNDSTHAETDVEKQQPSNIRSSYKTKTTKTLHKTSSKTAKTQKRNIQTPPGVPQNLSLIPLNPSFNEKQNKYDQISVTPLGDESTSTNNDSKTYNAVKPINATSLSRSKRKQQDQRKIKNSDEQLMSTDIEGQQKQQLHHASSNNDNVSTTKCSPKSRENTVLPLSSPSEGKTTNGDTQEEEAGEDHPKGCCSTFTTKEGRTAFIKQNTSKFPFGTLRTLYPVLLSIIALVCSILCKESTSFVTLGRPIYVDAQHETVKEIGLFFVELCKTDEYVTFGLEAQSSTITKVEYLDDGGKESDSMFFFGTHQIINELTEDVTKDTDTTINLDERPKDCRKLKLESALVHDGLWNTARILVGFTTGIGFLFAFALTTTTFWRTANLVAIASGIFLSYLCQSFAFLFFDTTICKKNLCYRSTGTSLAIIASACWFAAGIGTLIMYMHDRNKRHKKEIAEMRLKSRKKRQMQEAEFMSSQWAIYDYFSFFRPKSPSEETQVSTDSSAVASKSSI